MSFLEKFISIIAPHPCIGCNKEGSLLCADCAQKLPPAPSRCSQCGCPTADFRTCHQCLPRTALTRTWAVTPYQGAAKALIHKLKFERAAAAARDAARIMAPLIPTGTPWIVTHVPTATSRVRQRGYDQAALIAQAMAYRLKRPYVPLLARSGQQRQLGQSGTGRRAQLQGAFRVTRAPLINKSSILLVDDVLTTGSSMAAAAHVLARAGAQEIAGIVLAVAGGTFARDKTA